jgi:hypothetical protein
MKWIVIIVVLLIGGALYVRSTRQSPGNRSAGRHHRLDDSTSRRYPPTSGDEP